MNAVTVFVIAVFVLLGGWLIWQWKNAPTGYQEDGEFYYGEKK
jgi:Flp pilus assembly pilin Flp